MAPEPASVEVIEASEGDIPALLELWMELMEFHRPFNTVFELEDDAQDTMIRGWRDQFERDDRVLLVAKRGEIICGYLSGAIRSQPPVFKARQYGEIVDIAVRAQDRRQGLGDRMLREAISWFRQKEIDRVQIRVAPQNEIGSAFWRKYGFRDYLHELYLKLQ